MTKVERIIEWQAGRQRTPTEAVDFLRNEIARGACTKMLVVYHNGKTMAYVPASVNRDYSKSQELWDFEQWKRWFVSEEGE